MMDMDTQFDLSESDGATTMDWEADVQHRRPGRLDGPAGAAADRQPAGRSTCSTALDKQVASASERGRAEDGAGSVAERGRTEKPSTNAPAPEAGDVDATGRPPSARRPGARHRDERRGRGRQPARRPRRTSPSPRARPPRQERLAPAGRAVPHRGDAADDGAARRDARVGARHGRGRDGHDLARRGLSVVAQARDGGALLDRRLGAHGDARPSG